MIRERGFDVRFKFINALQLLRRATNLHDNRSLVIHPASTIFGEYDAAQLQLMGVRDTMVRVSVGIEEGRDLIAATTGKSPAEGSPAPTETTTPDSHTKLNDADRESKGGEVAKPGDNPPVAPAGPQPPALKAEPPLIFTPSTVPGELSLASPTTQGCTLAVVVCTNSAQPEAEAVRPLVEINNWARYDVTGCVTVTLNA